MDVNRLLFESSTVFTPSAPINDKDLFAGRLDQIRTTLNSVNQAGLHVAIYGERGVGKTSLANVIHAFFPAGSPIVTVKMNCDAGTTFPTLFKAILSEVTVTRSRTGPGFNMNPQDFDTPLEDMIDAKDINPNQLRLLFKSIGGKIIIIIDEFDRIEDTSTRRLLADTIKNFSDYGVDVTFILVGVADSVDALISEHQSVERALVQIKMPRMEASELEQIIQKGFDKLGLKIEADAKTKIINLSQGLPHYTHLLSLYAVQHAIVQSRDTVTIDDISSAIDEAIQKAQQSIKDAYYRAVSSTKANLFKQVLLACALADNDALGYFAPTDVKSPLKRITGKDYPVSSFVRHLASFCKDDRGPILQQSGSPRRYRYRFINPMMEPFVIMDGISKGYIDKTQSR